MLASIEFAIQRHPSLLHTQQEQYRMVASMLEYMQITPDAIKGSVMVVGCAEHFIEEPLVYDYGPNGEVKLRDGITKLTGIDKVPSTCWPAIRKAQNAEFLDVSLHEYADHYRKNGLFDMILMLRVGRLSQQAWHFGLDQAIGTLLKRKGVCVVTGDSLALEPLAESAYVTIQSHMILDAFSGPWPFSRQHMGFVLTKT